MAAVRRSELWQLCKVYKLWPRVVALCVFVYGREDWESHASKSNGATKSLCRLVSHGILVKTRLPGSMREWPLRMMPTLD